MAAPTMQAAVVEHPGGPEVLRLRHVPRPEARPGQVLVRVMAFGLNRSELFTRRGWSPSVTFPRILGIECVGVVAESYEAALPVGTKVAAAMGGMGRTFDGSYAEYTLLPASQLMPITTDLPWEVVAALPESYLTAQGSLETLEPQAGHRLLIRAATSSVGMAALALARELGVEIACTTRNPAKADALLHGGAHHVVLDDVDLPTGVRKLWPDGADRVLDLVGGQALLDSLRSTAPRGRVCNSGILSDSWTIPAFEPLEDIPSGVYLTTYSSSLINSGSWAVRTLQELLDRVANGGLHPATDQVFPFSRLADAHSHMESNNAIGKVVSHGPGLPA
ncbi:NADPH:quinone reductase-like Zn-dependent oxidoreductase [Kitasatospora sp. MAA4]|uniref:zinc-binding dehydrogenase n=1 Tax=Kitasatospora sp. MAA4 TaxID=3035093 RepID=UPI00247428B4|nr:zinc-binding dehydrogenase [Kitasatospora sp. MAA4]MDH6131752.1 NADPH:quinone reductase-like Zn-dependent oxidoreductase [Kitasatospora sp. MAA4]